ncbi:SIS domain-containing protein [Lactococcus garvieae]|nr:SIS domain-containing protein [Lactococcus garvieae]
MEKLSDTEIYTWEFLEENKSKVQLMSITQIAEEAHVSTATIVRTLKKRGFDGFADFKNFLKRNKNGSNGEENKILGLSDEANQYIFKNLVEVSRTIGLLNPAQLEAISKALVEANMIMTVARGASEAVADDMIHRFQTLGKNAISRYYDDMEMYAEKLTQADLMLIVSSTGEEKIIISAAKKAKKKGAKVVVFTSNHRSQLARISDYHLLAYQSKLEKEELYGDAGSILSLEVVCRIVVDMFTIYRAQGTIRQKESSL